MMCTGAEAAVLVASVAGTALSADASAKADADRKRALVQGVEEEAKIQDKANLATNDYVKETYDPTKRAQNYETQATDREAALGSLLAKQSEGGKGDITPATSGALSDTYTQAKAGATADSAQRARTLTKLLSRSGATGGLFGQEALTGADYASDVLGLGVNSKLNANLTNSRYNAAGNSGNNLALLGGLLSGAGRAYGGTVKPAQPTTTGG